MARIHKLVPFTWDTSSPADPKWRIPGALGALDLRSLPQQAAPGPLQQGFAFAVFDAPVAGGVDLGTDNLFDALSPARRTAIRNAMGLAPGASLGTTLLDALTSILTLHGDISGLARWKPLMPTVTGNMDIHLGGYSAVSSRVYDPALHTLVLPLLREQYRAIRAEARASAQVLAQEGMSWEDAKFEAHEALRGMPKDHPARPRWQRLAGLRRPDFHQRWLGAKLRQMRAYGFAERDLIPADLPIELAKEPGTTLTEDWDCADSDSITCDLTWTETAQDFDIVTNKVDLITTSLNSDARAESDLATDDHYCECGLKSDTGTTTNPGVCMRFASAERTYYCYRFRRDTTDTHEVTKVVTGSTTVLNTVNDGVAPSGAIHTCRGTIDGSSLSSTFDGTAKNSVTDTAITGNLRCGIYGTQTGSNRAQYGGGTSVWTAVDVTATTTTARILLV